MTSPTTRLIIGCGYLGRRVATRWVENGDTVYALTRSSTHAEELATLGVRPILGDVLDPSTLTVMPHASTVLYAVGHDRTGDASKRAVYVEGLRNVLAALPTSVERFVYISSTSVYGQSQGEVVDESSPCHPTTEGGQICLDAELLVRETLANRLSTHILRLSGIYGPGRLIARIDGLQAGRPLQVEPNGWLNLIHVEDATTAVIACTNHEATGSPLTLVSDDRPIQRRTFYETLAQLVSAPVPKFECSAEVTSQIGKRCNNRRLRDDLGITLAFPTIDAGLPHAVTAIAR
ncbi:MAG: SDR family oxidoreductase [Planctomycetaceae bacterium]